MVCCVRCLLRVAFCSLCVAFYALLVVRCFLLLLVGRFVSFVAFVVLCSLLVVFKVLSFVGCLLLPCVVVRWLWFVVLFALFVCS